MSEGPPIMPTHLGVNAVVTRTGDETRAFYDGREAIIPTRTGGEDLDMERGQFVRNAERRAGNYLLIPPHDEVVVFDASKQ